MNFTESVKSAINKYATFSGRASRSEYWYFSLFLCVATIAIAFTEYVVANALGKPQPSKIISALFSLATIIPSIAIFCRRLHDVNKSGWWMLISFTLIGFIPLMYWSCIKGTDGENRFGSDPLK